MASKILPQLVSITPNQLYLQLVNSTYDNIRQTNNGLTYVPVQFGGIFGQQTILESGLVMMLTSFEVT